jgi:hypothetical protein
MRSATLPEGDRGLLRPPRLVCMVTLSVMATGAGPGLAADAGPDDERGKVNWPSPWLAADWFVWDLFLGLSMLFAAPVFSGTGLQRATRILMRSVGVLCLLGLLGPLTGRLGLQSMGGVGYGLVFPVACLLMALVLRRRLQGHSAPMASEASAPIATRAL